ncbi:MAG: type II secretion system protein [Planctomycetota bacterium]
MKREAHSSPLGSARKGESRAIALATARGFSLIELLLVMAVTVVLTGLLLPVLQEVRENAHRVVCSSNLRQTGMMTVMYADDNKGCLPPSFFVEGGRDKREMMAAHRGGYADNWDGLGHLYKWAYCSAPEILYCPSHTGDHPFENYSMQYRQYRYHTFQTEEYEGDLEPIYTNYHYAGHLDWETLAKQRIDGVNAGSIIVATDGLRSVRDFNHRTGLNMLKGDGGVIWRDDYDTRQVANMLPDGFDGPGDAEPNYALIWKILGQ